jgi:hypothetical protein
MKLSGLEIFVSIIFIPFAAGLFYKEEYILAVLLLFGLLVILKLDELTDFTFNLKEGFKAKFEISKEKIEEDIRDNKKQVTKQKFLRFQNIESKILPDQQRKYGGEMKTEINFIYGQPDKPEFMYTPDGTLQTEDSIYFFEVKYIIDVSLAKDIIEKTTRYLERIYRALSPSAGKKLVIKLILASAHNIDISTLRIPEEIEVELINI